MQRVVSVFLYNGCAIDNTVLLALNEISASQLKPTKNKTKKITMLLDYMDTYPNTEIRYTSSYMTLHVDSDVAFLVAPKARIRVAGFFYCYDTIQLQHQDRNLMNQSVLNVNTLKHVVTSTTGPATCGLFRACQKVV